MTNGNVAYIKSHVESDLELNRRMTGRDYSAELGMVLNNYLANPENEQTLVLMGALDIGGLEERIGQETGLRPILPETKKCGIPIHRMWKEGDREGLAEIQIYADELMTRGLE